MNLFKKTFRALLYMGLGFGIGYFAFNKEEAINLNSTSEEPIATCLKKFHLPTTADMLECVYESIDLQMLEFKSAQIELQKEKNSDFISALDAVILAWESFDAKETMLLEQIFVESKGTMWQLVIARQREKTLKDRIAKLQMFKVLFNEEN
jgi:hypothetical protein